MPEMQLWIIVQATALKPLVPVCYSPTDQITENIMVKVEFESDAVIEAEILSKHGVTVHHAFTECDNLSVTPPNEKSHLVGHAPAKSTKILFCQLFKMQL